MDLKNVLKGIGFNSKESSVYLAALELGASPASDIAHRAKLNRVTTYDILDKLMRKGCISQYTQRGTKIFSATDPDALRENYRNKYMNFKAALPDFRRVSGTIRHPRVRYYEGIEGMKRIYADTLTAKTEILNYADSKSIREYWPAYDEEYVKSRVKKKIYLRGICPDDEVGKSVAAKNKNNYREIRLVPPSEFSFTNEINVYDDKVGIISFGEDRTVLGMIIESTEIANTQRAIFVMAWEFANMRKAR
ncbi:hypothetical protein HN748_02920 [Candidatus Peregrinibacteria bacterium]|jgi:HTH-type transcriptional regulator, sugar sensing transcriptional regulator|nr:hypothetical protein [Candidatus Peregrinibacteria bacterium]MBT7484193.1 hypothetical protein [Candidatus Peregrinibacteria bacterium]MBT7703159.1 hypothetical protein [Candidatus Peregrinibacteria bacterium]